MTRHHDLVGVVGVTELVVLGTVLANPSFAFKATDDPAPIGLDVRHRTPFVTQKITHHCASVK